MAKRAKSAKGEIDAFLRRLGERVRTMRSRRAMSRKVLARHSKVSERYLAQLEAGAGNCSIVLLRRIAHAMSVPVAELIDERPDRPVENLLLAQLIDRLAPAELSRARELLLAQFGGPSSATRNGRIALIGGSAVLLSTIILILRLLVSAAFLAGVYGAFGKAAASFALVMVALVIELVALLPIVQVKYLMTRAGRRAYGMPT